VRLPEKERTLSAGALESLLRGDSPWVREGETIAKTFTLSGFTAAIAFVNEVAGLANAADHHPDIHVERYRSVRVVLTTQATGRLSDADVELARAIDALPLIPPRPASR
jgi:4a-hydroxytetrahydrobiopterin dehydratase